MLEGKTVILGVTGSIAAYKAAAFASKLAQEGCDVHVIMTANATRFIQPLTFETLTGNRCVSDMFDRNFRYNVEHVALAKRADMAIVAPATANVAGKLARGIADDMLTATMTACKCRKAISPAMNTDMYDNPAVRDNLNILRSYGYTVIEPEVGYLACGDEGKGRMPEPETLLEYVIHEIAYSKDLFGKKVLVTAGPTAEAADPVRYLTNRSSGKMGYALARACAMRGAEVTLISGPTALQKPLFVDTVYVTTAAEMFDEVTKRSEKQDIVIKAAAVADYRPRYVSGEKIKKTDGEFALELERTEDILRYLGEHKRPGQFLCGFSMETENLLDNSRDKLHKKNLDMIVANSLKVPGAGFAGDTNVVTLITGEEEIALPLMSKDEAAHRIIDAIADRMAKREG